ncbi:MAG: tetratricopeptide repeat protein, partial [Gemmatimonadetes bacterium]|nr:tetratricopeptide repeat protein [Gemmatimonadota bacterium]
LPKQQTLRASIDWSYELLTEEERRLFRALSVFAGGWTLDAAERVGATEGAADWRILDRHCHLVEKSLVERVTEASGPGERSRYRMLEIMRQYAAARLCERGEEKAVRARHLAHFLSLAEAAEPHLRDAAQTEWIGRLDRERDNLQVAFQTADHDDDPELGLRLAGALGRYWLVRGRWDEGRGYCRRVLDRTPEHPGSAAQGRTLNASGNLAFHQGHYEQARRDHLAALAIRRAIGDATGEANSLNNLGEIARIQGDHDLARSSYEAAREIQERVRDQWGLAVSLNNLGEIAQVQGDLDTAEDLHGRALGLWAEIRDRWGAAWSLGNLGYVAAQRGDLEEARSYYARSLAKSREIRDEFGIALCQHALGDVAARQGDPDRALAHHTESLALRRRLGDRKGIAESLEALALLPGASPELAVRILGAAESIRETIHAPAPEPRRTDLRALAERLRAELGDAKFRSTWEAGRDLAANEAAAAALARNEVSATRR